MQRTEWLFQFPATEVLSAARVKAAHHRHRQVWWEKKQRQVITEAKSKGITINESLAMEYSKTGSNVMRGARLVIDTVYQEKLQECFAKVQEHRMKKEEYEGWIAVLKTTNEVLPLHMDDYLYFFGGI